MPSRWNMLVERLLSEDLTREEQRLALVIARQTLGWRRDEALLGQRLLREASRLHGRSFERARASLIEKGLLDFEPGDRGRGRRGRYALKLEKKAAVERHFEKAEKAAPKRPLGREERAAPERPEKAAPERPRIGGTKGKELPAKAIRAYVAVGGSLERADWREALASQATRLATREISEETILAAAAALGRERAFPGYLKQRAERLAREGGPCCWAGLDRSRLTAAQLLQCRCARCQAWAQEVDRAERVVLREADQLVAEGKARWITVEDAS